MQIRNSDGRVRGRGAYVWAMTKVDRPRKRGQRCRIIGNQGSDISHDQKKKTWKYLMRDKQEREKEMRKGMQQKEGKEREGTDNMQKGGGG